MSYSWNANPASVTTYGFSGASDDSDNFAVSVYLDQDGGSSNNDTIYAGAIAALDTYFASVVTNDPTRWNNPPNKVTQSVTTS